MLICKKSYTVKIDSCFLLKMSMCTDVYFHSFSYSKEVKFVYISLHKQL